MNNQELLFAISEMMDEKLDKKLDEKLKPIDDSIKGLENQYQSLETQYQSLDGSVKALETQYQSLDGSVKALENQYQSLDNSFKTLEIRTKKLELLVENNVLPRLETIESCYTSTYRRYSDGIDQIERMQADIDVIKQVVTGHSEKIKQLQELA